MAREVQSWPCSVHRLAAHGLIASRSHLHCTPTLRAAAALCRHPHRRQDRVHQRPRPQAGVAAQLDRHHRLRLHRPRVLRCVHRPGLRGGCQWAAEAQGAGVQAGWLRCHVQAGCGAMCRLAAMPCAGWRGVRYRQAAVLHHAWLMLPCHPCALLAVARHGYKSHCCGKMLLRGVPAMTDICMLAWLPSPHPLRPPCR
jgi:hypothetical protein